MNFSTEEIVTRAKSALTSAWTMLTEQSLQDCFFVLTKTSCLKQIGVIFLLHALSFLGIPFIGDLLSYAWGIFALTFTIKNICLKQFVEDGIVSVKEIVEEARVAIVTPVTDAITAFPTTLRETVVIATNGGQGGLSINSIMREANNHSIGISVGIKHLAQCNNLSQSIETCVMLGSMVGIEKGLLQDALARLFNQFTRASPVVQQHMLTDAKQMKKLVGLASLVTSIAAIEVSGKDPLAVITRANNNKLAIEGIMETMEEVGNSLGLCSTGKWKVIEEIRETIEPLLKQFEEISINLAIRPAIYCQPAEHNKFLTFVRDVQRLSKQLRESTMPELRSGPLVADVARLANALNGWQTRITAVRSSTGLKPLPAAILLVGDSQLGKTELFTELNARVNEYLHGVYLSDPAKYAVFANSLDWTIWNYQMRDDFDTGFNGQETMYVDDGFSKKDGSDHAMYLSYINGNAVGTVQASLDQKGAPFECRSVYVSCNEAPKKSPAISNIYAVQNRFKIAIQCTLKPGRHVPGENDPYDFDFTHLKLHVGDLKTHCANGGKKCLDQDMSVQQITKLIADHIVRNEETFQTKINHRLQRRTIAAAVTAQMDSGDESADWDIEDLESEVNSSSSGESISSESTASLLSEAAGLSIIQETEEIEEVEEEATVSSDVIPLFAANLNPVVREVNNPEADTYLPTKLMLSNYIQKAYANSIDGVSDPRMIELLTLSRDTEGLSSLIAARADRLTPLEALESKNYGVISGKEETFSQKWLSIFAEPIVVKGDGVSAIIWAKIEGGMRAYLVPNQLSGVTHACYASFRSAVLNSQSWKDIASYNGLIAYNAVSKTANKIINFITPREVHPTSYTLGGLATGLSLYYSGFVSLGTSLILMVDIYILNQVTRENLNRAIDTFAVGEEPWYLRRLLWAETFEKKVWETILTPFAKLFDASKNLMIKCATYVFDALGLDWTEWLLTLDIAVITSAFLFCTGVVAVAACLLYRLIKPETESTVKAVQSQSVTSSKKRHIASVKKVASKQSVTSNGKAKKMQAKVIRRQASKIVRHQILDKAPYNEISSSCGMHILDEFKGNTLEIEDKQWVLNAPPSFENGEVVIAFPKACKESNVFADKASFQDLLNTMLWVPETCIEHLQNEDTAVVGVFHGHGKMSADVQKHQRVAFFFNEEQSIKNITADHQVEDVCIIRRDDVAVIVVDGLVRINENGVNQLYAHLEPFAKATGYSSFELEGCFDRASEVFKYSCAFFSKTFNAEEESLITKADLKQLESVIQTLKGPLPSFTWQKVENEVWSIDQSLYEVHPQGLDDSAVNLMDVVVDNHLASIIRVGDGTGIVTDASLCNFTSTKVMCCGILEGKGVLVPYHVGKVGTLIRVGRHNRQTPQVCSNWCLYRVTKTDAFAHLGWATAVSHFETLQLVREASERVSKKKFSNNELVNGVMVGYQPFAGHPTWIANHLMKEEELLGTVDRCELIQYLPRINMVTPVTVAFAGTQLVNYAGGAETNRVLRVTSMQIGNFLTQFGDCGGPVLVANTKVPKKICGFHIAGNDSRGYSCLLTVEAFLAISEPVVEPQSVGEFKIINQVGDLSLISLEPGKPASLGSSQLECWPPVTWDENDPFKHVIEEGFIGDDVPEGESALPIGKLLVPNDYVGRRFKPSAKGEINGYHKSPFFGAFEVQKEPSLLSEKDPRRVKPLPLNRAGKPALAWPCHKMAVKGPGKFPQKVLEKCVINIRNAFVNKMRGKKIGLGLSASDDTVIDRGLNGVPHGPCLGPLNLKASSGLPWTSKAGCAMKSDLVEADEMGVRSIKENSNGRLFRTILKHKLARARKLKRVVSLTPSKLKDELVKKAQIVDGKTRIFNAVPIEVVLLTRGLFSGFSEEFLKNTLDYHHFLGLDTNSLSWDLMERHMRHFPNHFDVDFKNYDKTIQSVLLRAAYWIMISVIETVDPDGLSDARFVLCEENINTLLVDRSGVWMSEHSNKSGDPMTTIINILVNILLGYVGYNTLVKECSYSEWCDNVRCVFLGDDGRFSVSDEVKHLFNQASYFKLVAEWGFDATPATKGPLIEVDFVPVEEMSFLKCISKEVGIFFMAALEKRSIESTFGWTQVPTEDTDIWKLIVRSNLEKCVAWGKEYYEFFSDSLTKHVCSVDFPSRVLGDAILAELEIDYETQKTRLVDKFCMFQDDPSISEQVTASGGNFYDWLQKQDIDNLSGSIHRLEQMITTLGQTVQRVEEAAGTALGRAEFAVQLVEKVEETANTALSRVEAVIQLVNQHEEVIKNLSENMIKVDKDLTALRDRVDRFGIPEGFMDEYSIVKERADRAFTAVFIIRDSLENCWEMIAMVPWALRDPIISGTFPDNLFMMNPMARQFNDKDPIYKVDHVVESYDQLDDHPVAQIRLELEANIEALNELEP